MNTRLLPLLATLVISGSAFAQKAPDLKKLDAYIADAMVKFDQPGLAVGIVKDGTLVYGKGFGKLDLAKADPVTPNSIFFIASMSKAFTACAIGLLVDDGKLEWNDPVRKHMLWFNTPDPYVTEHMMVKDLLCHRSGWITFDGDLLWYGTDLDQREILERHAHEPMGLPFRDEFGYSNLMFIAAAQLIEAVSGKTWDAFVTERILTPLGMSRTTVDTKALASMPDIALPHVRSGQVANAPQVSMPYQTLEGADGACGINSCINDLAKWDAMWANEGKVDGKAFISDATYGEITAIHLAMGGRRDGAALGWFVEENNGNTVITHSGGMPGFILDHAVVPEKDLAVICLGNGESYSVFAITNKILDLYLGDGKADPVADILPRLQSVMHAKCSAGRTVWMHARRTRHPLWTWPLLRVPMRTRSTEKPPSRKCSADPSLPSHLRRTCSPAIWSIGISTRGNGITRIPSSNPDTSPSNSIPTTRSPDSRSICTARTSTSTSWISRSADLLWVVASAKPRNSTVSTPALHAHL